MESNKRPKNKHKEHDGNTNNNKRVGGILKKSATNDRMEFLDVKINKDKVCSLLEEDKDITHRYYSLENRRY